MLPCTRCTSPATSWSRAFSYAVPLWFVSVTPARERRRVVVFIQDHDVVGLPVQAAGEVRDLDFLLTARRVEPPQQRRLGDEVVGDLGETEAPGIVERDLTADPQDRTAVHRHDLRLDRLVHAGLRIGPIHVYGPADVLLEELLGAQQVELVVLLEHLQRTTAERSDVDRFGLDTGRDVAVLQSNAPRREVECPDLAHEPEVLVVHGYRHRVTLCGRGTERRSFLSGRCRLRRGGLGGGRHRHRREGRGQGK